MIRPYQTFYALAITLLALVTEFAQASDREKEKRWADQIVDFMVVGEAVWLQDDKAKFLGLYSASPREPGKGAAIIVHGLGAHPDWQDVVAPLRTGLPEHGWSTLSIQMPILPNEADVAQYGPLFAEVPARFEAAIAYLKEQGHETIVIVAHSLGTAMTASYLASHPDAAKRIQAFVAIGMRDGHGNDERMHTAAFLKQLSLPTLDLYGTEDKEAVDTAKARLDAGRTQGVYEQTAEAGADHFFRGKNDRLLEIVVQWLDAHVKP